MVVYCYTAQDRVRRQVHQEEASGDIPARCGHAGEVIMGSPNLSPLAIKDIEKEIHILAEMENENIIYLHQVYENAQFVILIIEL